MPSIRLKKLCSQSKNLKEWGNETNWQNCKKKIWKRLIESICIDHEYIHNSISTRSLTYIDRRWLLTEARSGLNDSPSVQDAGKIKWSILCLNHSKLKSTGKIEWLILCLNFTKLKTSGKIGWSIMWPNLTN